MLTKTLEEQSAEPGIISLPDQTILNFLNFYALFAINMMNK